MSGDSPGTTGTDRGELPDQPGPGPPRVGVARVVRAESKRALEAVRRSVQRGQPYGSEPWYQRIVQRLGLESTLHPRGRPRKTPPDPENDPQTFFVQEAEAVTSNVAHPFATSIEVLHFLLDIFMTGPRPLVVS